MNNIIAYHVSANQYQPNQRVCLSGISHFVERMRIDPHYDQVENVLEKLRPSTAKSRSLSLFAYPDIFDCRAFWEGERNTGNASYQSMPIYYSVRLPAPTKVPSHLIARTSRLMQEKLHYRDAAQEFWTPSKAWKCWEYMDTEFIVLAIQATPIDDAHVYGYRMLCDCDLANNLWPLPR